MTEKTSSKAATEIMALVGKIAPMLHGRDSSIVGGVLADLHAIWLAGHYDMRGPVHTKRLRKRVMRLQMETTENLIEPNERMAIKAMREAEQETSGQKA